MHNFEGRNFNLIYVFISRIFTQYGISGMFFIQFGEHVYEISIDSQKLN